MQQAKTQLSALLARVEAGETIEIARGDRAVARLVPLGGARRELGFGSYQVPEAFFDELPEDELDAWEAR